MDEVTHKRVWLEANAPAHKHNKEKSKREKRLSETSLCATWVDQWVGHHNQQKHLS